MQRDEGREEARRVAGETRGREEERGGEERRTSEPAKLLVWGVYGVGR